MAMLWSDVRRLETTDASRMVGSYYMLRKKALDGMQSTVFSDSSEFFALAWITLEVPLCVPLHEVVLMFCHSSHSNPNEMFHQPTGINV